MAANEARVIRTESNGPLVSGIAMGFVVASAAVLSLRLYTRLVLLKTVGKDDWTISLAMACSVVVTIITCLEVKYGMGRHSENVSAAETMEQLKYLLADILTYNMGMNVAKVSFLLQYRRIFVSKAVQRVCFWAMLYVVIWACVQATLLGLSCLPIASIVPSTAGFCLDTLPIWYFSSAMSLATDFMIFCIPLPSVLKLQLPTKQKALLFCVFCLGFSVCIISVYRIFTLRVAVDSEDPPWDNIGAAIWSVIELNTSIIAASLPTIRPLLAKWLPRAGLSSARDKTGEYNRYGPSSGISRGNFIELNSGRRETETSTEDLVLKDMGAGQARSMPSVYSHVTTGPGLGSSSQQAGGDHKKHIVVTTETRIKERRRT
ncbi:integral membrane protein [Colletotrichum tofieldiae]|uniref:Integral membrane protein n=1 Tax=Colletotrichum tofieldiae TaxID=708197 RepID=A0A166SQ04_9PEZI|nr:integral membrane protein [Colletotrichum tofieldiae]